MEHLDDDQVWSDAVAATGAPTVRFTIKA